MFSEFRVATGSESDVTLFCTFLRDVIFSANRDTWMFAKNNTSLGYIEVR